MASLEFNQLMDARSTVAGYGPNHTPYYRLQEFPEVKVYDEDDFDGMTRQCQVEVCQDPTHLIVRWKECTVGRLPVEYIYMTGKVRTAEDVRTREEEDRQDYIRSHAGRAIRSTFFRAPIRTGGHVHVDFQPYHDNSFWSIVDKYNLM
jgi:hypothetical protein